MSLRQRGLRELPAQSSVGWSCYGLIQTGKSLKLLATGLSDGRTLGFPEVDRVKIKVKGEEQEVPAPLAIFTKQCCK